MFETDTHISHRREQPLRSIQYNLLPPDNYDDYDPEKETGYVVRPTKRARAVTARSQWVYADATDKGAKSWKPLSDSDEASISTNRTSKHEIVPSQLPMTDEMKVDMASRWWTDHLRPRSNKQASANPSRGKGKSSSGNVGWIRFTPSGKYCASEGFVPSQYLLPHEIEVAHRLTKTVANRVLKHGVRGVHYAIGWLELYHLIKAYGQTTPDNHIVRPGVANHEVILSYSGPSLVLDSDKNESRTKKKQHVQPWRKPKPPPRLGIETVPTPPETSSEKRKSSTVKRKRVDGAVTAPDATTRKSSIHKEKEKRLRKKRKLVALRPPGDPSACDHDSLCRAVLWGSQQAEKDTFREWYAQSGLHVM